jgi:hypothetical protein
MTRPFRIPSLDSLLTSGEWDGIEFKASRGALPKSAFETVSAFANMLGLRDEAIQTALWIASSRSPSNDESHTLCASIY